MNKKAATYGFWIELILFIVLFVGSLALIGIQMNDINNKNYDYSFGLVTNSTLDDLKSYQNTVANSTNEGQSSLTSFGFFILTTLPHMLLTANSLIWNFVSGGFINTIVELMNIGEFGYLVVIIFKLIYFLAIAFILMKIITKVPI